MAGERKHPQIRARIAPNLALQARDRQILLGVHKYRYLSRKQIQAFFGFKSLTRVNTRLRKLFDAKFLDRIFIPAFWGSPEAYYCLGVNGIMVAAEKSEDISIIKKRRRQVSKTSPIFLKHQIMINEVLIAFELAGKRLNGCQIKFSTDNIQIITRLNKVFRPDGYLVFSYYGKTYPLFLEADLGTESLKRIQEKMENYLTFGLSGEYGKLFGCKYFKVIFVFSSAKRLENIKKLIGGKTDKMFWLAEAKHISHQMIFRNIWHRPRKEGLFSFLPKAPACRTGRAQPLAEI
ncbi:MAG: replication-relaxation family protein [bacterium]